MYLDRGIVDLKIQDTFCIPKGIIVEIAAVAGDGEKLRQGAVAEGGIFVGKGVVMRWAHVGRGRSGQDQVLMRLRRHS